ncbi:transcription/translation regulatory transformer protein RfaH [Pseudomonas sp. NPDC078700]|uniref:transcription/translation regulatory transformer protein RfaH n=1 Tax=Pseudomonas sp. NPDC078700 TaxID=3364424 RepID=UPI0037C7F5DC
MESLNTALTSWYLLQCKPRQDSRAALNLQHQQYTVFHPQISRKPVLGEARSNGLEALFPGYLFIALSQEDNWGPLRSTRGVSRIVSFNNTPLKVPDHVIEHLYERCRTYQSGPTLAPGDTVQIVQGPLNTLEGIFLSMDGHERVVVLLQLLSREHQVRIPVEYIKSA